MAFEVRQYAHQNEDLVGLVRSRVLRARAVDGGFEPKPGTAQKMDWSMKATSPGMPSAERMTQPAHGPCVHGVRGERDETTINHEHTRSSQSYIG